MASNQSRFIDRFPTILTAGKATDSLGDSVASCFRWYTLTEAHEALKHAAKVATPPAKPTYKPEPYANNGRKGIFTDIRPSLRPDNRTTYEILIDELKDTTFDSHWNKTLGHTRFPAAGLPAGFDPTARPFGQPTAKGASMKELINPPKGVYQVLEEAQAGHELYRVSHNGYNPGERVDRRYAEPPFDRHRRYGEKSKYDPRGIWVRCACHWHRTEPETITNKIQADFCERYKSKLGTVLEPNKVRDFMPEDHTYGTPKKKDLYGVEELLKDVDCPPCLFKADFKCWLASFNKLYERMKKRCNSPTGGFSFNDLYKRLLYYDKTHSGRLPLEMFYKVSACYDIHYDQKNLEALLTLLKIIDENGIDYAKFLAMMDYKQPPLQLEKIQDVPARNQYYVTTLQASTCDYLIINNATWPTAGIPLIRHDLGRPTVPLYGCRADLDNLCEDTTAAILINPSIFTNYGLSYRDLFRGREKSVIRALFEKIGYVFETNGKRSFDELWKMGVELDKNEMVCVETFWQLLKQHYPEERKIIVDEAAC